MTARTFVRIYDMKKIVDMSADETLKKIDAAITGKRPAIIPWYLKSEFVGKVEGSKFRIQKTRSNGGYILNYIYARVFYGTVAETPDGKAEIDGRFRMNGIIRGVFYAFCIMWVVGAFSALLSGENIHEMVFLYAFFVFAAGLIFKLFSMAFRKDEAAVLEFLEGLK